ncbi:MAG: mechanosensitive ion channel family protein [Bacilli bacterium]
MNFFQNFSKILSDLTGISETPILLTTYSIIAIIIIDLLAKGITFLNTKLNKNDKNLYLFNKKTHIAKIIITIIVILFIWEEQIQNIITFISFVSAAATLAIRDVIINFFAGLFITVYKPFKIEDRIEIKDATGNIIGDVVNINSLNFEILEVNGKEEGEQSTGIIVQIPNSKVFTNPIKNYTKAFKYIWSELEIKINLNANLEENKRVLYDIVKSNDIVKKIPKKMKDQLNEAVGDYRIYYNNLEPIIYTKLTEDYVDLTIRYLAHPKKARHIESQIWNKIYENAKEGKLDLYTTNELKKETKDSSKK